MALMDSRESPDASPATDGEGWLTRERVLTIALALATLLALYVCYLLIKPFVPAITVAVAVAVATKRSYNWLLTRVQSKSLAAGIGVILVACLIVIPLSLLITYLLRQINTEVQHFLKGGDQSDWRSFLNLPPVVEQGLDWIQA